MNPFDTIFPSDDEKKRMFAIAVEMTIKRAVTLHDYKFENNTYQQKQGGSIGLNLTEVGADMCHCDIQLIERITVRKLTLYKIYKDGTTFESWRRRWRRKNMKKQ